MLSSMVGAYNRDRDDDDAAAIAKATAENGGVLPKELDPALRLPLHKPEWPGRHPQREAGEARCARLLVDDDVERKGGFERGPGNP